VLESEAVAAADMRFSLWADMRYRRQFYELRIPVAASAERLRPQELQQLSRRFEDEYVRRYGAGARHGEDRIEYVRFGVDAIGRTPRPEMIAVELDGADPTRVQKDER